ncbi:Chromate resistance protein ChrB [Streptomyces sp. NPDC005529]|uniref:Chromate resistance protein ChrB n=1 Tax=unclassified Streptomyces TaxID=2593676 RepID=UPI0033A3C558
MRAEEFTLAELEEEDQSLERLPRQHGDLTARDVVGTLEATEAAERLKQSTAACEGYAEHVFRALHQTPEEEQ